MEEIKEEKGLDVSNTSKPGKKKDKKEKTKKTKIKKNRTGLLKLFQHILIAVAMVAIVVVMVGSTVSVEGIHGSSTYKLSPSDEGRKYEDSVLFNTVFGNEISNVLRLVTIKSQIETNGAYNPDIIIDVAAYNSRNNGKNVSKNNTVTAKYRLGDLLKWAKYGFDSEDVSVDMMSASANALASSDGGEGLTYDLVVNRYKTADGLRIEECVSNWDDYNILVQEIENASYDLYLNYSDYLKLDDYLSSSKSNIRYYVLSGKDKDKQVFTNTGLSSKDVDKAMLTFKEYGKYISYDSDKMIYKTDTAINENTFNSLLKKYEYAFADNCKIIIAADMSMPVKDGIYSASYGFNNYLPFVKQLIAIAALCIILYIAIWILCTLREGHAVNENGVKYIALTSFDNTSIELWLLLVITIVLAVIFGLAVIADLLFDTNAELIAYIRNLIYDPLFIGIFAVAVFFIDMLMLGMYYSLVRRIKSRTIWSGSLLRKFVLYIRQIVYGIYDNGTIVLRSVVPCVIVMLVNIIFMVAASGLSGFGSLFLVLIVLAFDILISYFVYNQLKSRQSIIEGMKKIIDGDHGYKADITRLHGDNVELASCVNSIGDSIRNAVEQSMKDERMKTELVANVSHDIRTPLTSIINYVDLIKRENIEDETIASYIQIIDEKSQRLKTLTEDLIEASKVSSGTIELELQRMNFAEMVNQSLAEFAEKFEEKRLSCVCRSENLSKPVLMADGKSLWRVMENLLGNVYKYAMSGTRVFIDMFNVTKDDKEYVVLQIRNMSDSPLPEDLSKLTERFMRGDESRTSEGSGLGLSIAKSLTELMGGTFEIASDADLFKVEVVFEAID